MLFVEATSSLDAESKKAISDNLRSILKGRTAFIIANRLATIRSAGFILVLGKGRLVQSGNHE
jgi:ABC-type multidrug transport system fused ATPase/permease subunit